MFTLLKNAMLCVCSELVSTHLIVKIFLTRRLGTRFKLRTPFLSLFKQKIFYMFYNLNPCTKMPRS